MRFLLPKVTLLCVALATTPVAPRPAAAQGAEPEPTQHEFVVDVQDEERYGAPAGVRIVYGACDR